MVIKIKNNGEVLTLQFSELRNYHGNVALMAIGVGFRMVEAALTTLYGEDIPERKSIAVLAGHAGPGFRDAFEFTTRAVTRGAYTVDVNYPTAQYDPYRPQSYAFVVSNEEGAAVEVSLKENFLPAVFYEYLKKGREGTMTPAEHEANEELKAELCERALQLAQEELLDVRVLSTGADYLLLDSGVSFSSLTARLSEENSKMKVIDQYDFPNYDLTASGHKFLLIDEFIDQELMFAQKDKIRAFLDEGNILMFSGHLFREWIPGASIFVPKTINSHLDYVVTVLDHPIFEGVQSEDITYNRGVSGFFCRGHHPIPEGVEVLLELPGGEPITYIDRVSSKGTILMHSGRNLLRYRHRNNSAGRIGEQLEKFLYEEYNELQQRRGHR